VSIPPFFSIQKRRSDDEYIILLRFILFSQTDILQVKSIFITVIKDFALFCLQNIEFMVKS